jgi:D-alanyl-D-alanine carboxypeptidase
LRFIGVEAATDMAKRGIGTLEEYFGLDAAPGYP